MNKQIRHSSSEAILEKINQSAISFLLPQSLEEVYKTIVEQAQKLVEGHYASLFIHQDGTLVRVFTTLPYAEKVKIREKGFTYASYIDRKTLVLPVKIFRKYHPEIAKLGVKANVFIPVAYRGAPVGVLIVNSTNKDTFTQRELSILKLFGSMASLAIRKVQSNTETEQALASRDLFISLASHELRTPLTSVNGYAQLLYNRLSKKPNTNIARWAKELLNECKRLNTLAGELLTVNLIKGGKLNYHLTEHSILEIVNQALANFQFVYPERKVIFQNNLKEEDSIICDRDKLLQVIGNLLDNAAKFSTSDTEIALNLRSDPSEVILRVVDKGKGIPKKDQPNIFDTFVKGSNTNQEEGMGLGLFLTKAIIDKHHGEIRIKSKEDKGTKVEISLPKATYAARN